MTKIFAIRIEPKVLKELKVYCSKHGLTITKCITDLIQKLIKEKK